MAKKINYFNLSYGPFFKFPRRIVKHFMSLIYPFITRIWKLPKIKTIEETLIKIKEEGKSIIRFGDSEMLYIMDRRNLPYQVFDKKLRDRLAQLLLLDDDKILIGLPDAYRSVSGFEDEMKTFWRSQVSYVYPRVHKLLNLDKQYYNANITRLYFGYKNKKISESNFILIRSIWDNKKILLIEGDKSRLGVGNDLFSNAISVDRILGPAHNAFSKVNELLLEAKKFSKEYLVLVAMGPTAKYLVYDLVIEGFQAIDIGNLDLEYEWFKRGSKDRIIIPGKYTSEVKGGRDVADINDSLYTKQIVIKILND
jgi:glycosyltransferase family protein